MYLYTFLLPIDLVDHITPWWALLVEAGNIIDIGLSWERMVGKQCGAGTEPNACTITHNPIELSTLVGEHSVWQGSIGDHYHLEIVLLCLVW